MSDLNVSGKPGAEAINRLEPTPKNESLAKAEIENSIFEANAKLTEIRKEVSEYVIRDEVKELIQNGAKTINDKLSEIKDKLGSVADTYFKEAKKAITDQIDSETKNVLKELETKDVQNLETQKYAKDSNLLNEL